MLTLSGYFDMSSDKINTAQFAIAAFYSFIMDVLQFKKALCSKNSFVATSSSSRWHVNNFTDRLTHLEVKKADQNLFL